jgi:hypothetical protein
VAKTCRAVSRRLASVFAGACGYRALSTRVLAPRACGGSALAASPWQIRVQTRCATRIERVRSISTLRQALSVCLRLGSQ